MNTTLKLQNFFPGLRPFARLRRGYLRSIEITAIGLTLLAITAVGYLFFNVLRERNQNLNALHTESRQLRQQIDQIRFQQSHSQKRATGTQVALDNLEEFNNRFLKDPVKGRLILIDEINKLVRENNVLLQGGINFRSVEDADEVALREQNKNSKVRRGKSDSVDIYPGMRVDFSVSGSYENFRKFLYDLETNDLFIIIERVNLTTSEGQLAGVRNPQNMRPAGDDPANGNLSIQLDLRVYFSKKKVDAAS